MASLGRGGLGFIGGGLIGAWLYGLLWGMDSPGDAAPWGLWGLAGLALCSVVYGVRLLPPQSRVAGLVVAGVVTGVLLGGSVGDTGAGFWGMLLSTSGGLLVVAVLPLPARLQDAPAATETPA